MRKQLFITILFFVIGHLCVGQVLSLQMNAAGGKYFYLAHNIYDESYQVTYSGGWTGALETSLIIEKLGFPWLGLNLGIGWKNCYIQGTLRHKARIPRTNLTAYTLSEGNIRWNFTDFRILPEVKVFKIQNLYMFAGYYYSSLYRIKTSGIGKTQYDTFPESVKGGEHFEQVLKNKDLSFENQGLEVKGTSGFSFGLRYVWKNLDFQIRDDYGKGKNAPYVWFNNHSLTFGIGYNLSIF